MPGHDWKSEQVLIVPWQPIEQYPPGKGRHWRPEGIAVHCAAEVHAAPTPPTAVPASKPKEHAPNAQTEPPGQVKQVEPPAPQAAVEVPGLH